MLLDKKNILLERDSNGELLPVTVTLEILNDDSEVVLKPMTKGELAEISSYAKLNDKTGNEDVKLISKFCIKPSFTEEEANVLKPGISQAIIIALLSISSGIDQKTLSKKLEDKTNKLSEVEELMEQKKN